MRKKSKLVSLEKKNQQKHKNKKKEKSLHLLLSNTIDQFYM